MAPLSWAQQGCFLLGEFSHQPWEVIYTVTPVYCEQAEVGESRDTGTQISSAALHPESPQGQQVLVIAEEPITSHREVERASVK